MKSSFSIYFAFVSFCFSITPSMSWVIYCMKMVSIRTCYCLCVYGYAIIYSKFSVIFSIGLLCKAFMVFTYVLLLVVDSSFITFFHVGVLSIIKVIFLCLFIQVFILFLSWIHYIYSFIFIDLYKVKNLCIIWMKYTWSWYIIFIRNSLLWCI